MVKTILLYLLILTTLMAVDPDLLAIEAKIYPKIVQFDKNLSEKLIDKKIVFSIIYNAKTYKDASILKELLEEQGFGAKLETKPMEPLPTAYIITTKPSKKIFQKLLSSDRMIFATESSILPYSLIGLHIGVRIKPYINIKTLKKTHIALNPIIFRVSKIYEQN